DCKSAGLRLRWFESISAHNSSFDESREAVRLRLDFRSGLQTCLSGTAAETQTKGRKFGGFQQTGFL
ncbi:hypothetical protein, partial [Rikenella microfusus]|uniref:hypothetical protein n=1 Tax=Rikenella microfusus TaxID=28139 RepID=UPI00266E9B95